MQKIIAGLNQFYALVLEAYSLGKLILCAPVASTFGRPPTLGTIFQFKYKVTFQFPLKFF